MNMLAREKKKSELKLSDSRIGLVSLVLIKFQHLLCFPLNGNAGSYKLFKKNNDLSKFVEIV